jgi:hypothetical protein
MKKIIFIFLILMSLVHVIAQEKKTEMLVVATFVVGDVSVNRTKLIKVTKNFIFLTGDEVVTKKGTVDIQFGSGSVVRVAKNTVVKISRIMDADQKQNVNIGLVKGEVFSKVSKKMPPGSTFEIASPTITAGVRGTEFLISDGMVSGENNSDGVFVKEGEVTVIVNENDSVKDFNVKAGEEVVITTQGILKQILEDHIKEKMRILDTLQVMKEDTYRLLKEQKEKNKELLNNKSKVN